MTHILHVDEFIEYKAVDDTDSEDDKDVLESEAEVLLDKHEELEVEELIARENIILERQLVIERLI